MECNNVYRYHIDIYQAELINGMTYDVNSVELKYPFARYNQSIFHHHLCLFYLKKPLLLCIALFSKRIHIKIDNHIWTQINNNNVMVVVRRGKVHSDWQPEKEIYGICSHLLQIATIISELIPRGTDEKPGNDKCFLTVIFQSHNQI